MDSHTSNKSHRWLAVCIVACRSSIQGPMYTTLQVLLHYIKLKVSKHYTESVWFNILEDRAAEGDTIVDHKKGKYGRSVFQVWWVMAASRYYFSRPCVCHMTARKASIEGSALTLASDAIAL